MDMTTNHQIMEDRQLSGALSMPGMVFLISPLQLITLGDQLFQNDQDHSVATEINFPHNCY